MENEVADKGSEATVKYAFVQTQIPYHPITLLCHVLKVSRSGYYRWQRNIPSQREQADKKLLVEI